MQLWSAFETINTGENKPQHDPSNPNPSSAENIQQACTTILSVIFPTKQTDESSNNRKLWPKLFYKKLQFQEDERNNHKLYCYLKHQFFYSYGMTPTHVETKERPVEVTTPSSAPWNSA